MLAVGGKTVAEEMIGKGIMTSNSEFIAPALDADVSGIITTLFDIDFANDWDQVLKSLVVGSEDRSNHKSVESHLDHAENNARIAHRLWCNADMKRKNYDLDVEATMAAMRAEATGKLQDEKDAGTRAKAITEGDVTAKMMELHPDEYRAVEVRKHQIKLLGDHALDLAKQATSKCKSLQTMLAKMRGGGVTD